MDKEEEASDCPSVPIAETNVARPKASNHTRTNNDDFLGTRPHLDTIANLTFLVEHCKEIEGASGVNDVVNCLSILEHEETKYFSIPKEVSNARGNKLDDVLRHSSDDIADSESVVMHDVILAGEEIHPESFFGKCDGPVIPFHVYWTGSASWRVELFIKAYLYTQNLACSRLWLWLDSDLDANAIDRMLCQDPIFQRFRPLVARGDIVLKSWKFPDRVPLAQSSPETASTPDTGSNMISEEDEIVLANGTVQDSDGQQWLHLKSTSASLAPVQVSDAVRFIVLHLHGGVYCDMDVLLLRDMRPLLLPDPVSGPRAFAEQWVERCGPYDYNTAVISLPANSTLSSYLLRGGVRMGMNFHPRVIGRMLWKDGKGDAVTMLHNAVFDPLVTNLRREGTETCTVPCHKNFQSAFMSEVEEKGNEWSNYHGEVKRQGEGNRTLANFFRGAWAYHIHNQVCLSIPFSAISFPQILSLSHRMKESPTANPNPLLSPHSGGNYPNRPPGWTSSRALKTATLMALERMLMVSGGRDRCWKVMTGRDGRLMHGAVFRWCMRKASPQVESRCVVSYRSRERKERKQGINGRREGCQNRVAISISIYTRYWW